MSDSEKTKKQLIEELKKLRKKITKIEESLSEGKEREKELLRDYALFRSFMEHIPVSVYFKDKEGKFLLASEYFLKQRGAPKLDSVEKLIGKTDFDLFSKEHAEISSEDELQVMKTGKPIIDREETERLEGEEVYLSTSKASLKDDNGHTIGIIGITLDITEQKRLEKALLFHKLLLESLLDYTPDHIYFKDRESCFVQASKSVAEQFGVKSVDDLIGKTDFDYFTKEHAEAAYKDEQEIIRTGNPILNKVERETHPDGTVTWVSTTKIPWYDEYGDIIGILGVSRDITEKKKLEDKLEKRVEELGEEIVFKSRLLTVLLENAPDHIYFKDKKSRFVAASKALAEWLGAANPEDMIGKTDFDYFTEEHAKPAFKDEQKVMKSGKAFEGKIEKETYADGRANWVSTSKIPWYDEDGNIIGTFGISRDVTERKKKEEELIETRKIAEKASYAKTTFLAIMSHEIRTPLNAIIGMCEILEETVLSKEQHNYLKVLREAGENLLSIINDVLDISKIECGDVKIEESEFFLDDLVERVCDILAIRAHKKGVELVSHVSPNVPVRLIGDSYRMRQILVNLIGNSIKFTDKGEVVLNVKLAEEEDIQCETKKGNGVCLLFTVRDTGIGIPADKREAIFDSFEQADSSTTRKFGGTGLGLSISKRLVELMGGKMWVESEEGKGSEFFFTVQFGAQKAKKTRTFIEPEEVDVRGISVLIVDDNATNRLILKEILTAWDADTVEASGGKEAISIIRSARKEGKNFRLVLLDRRMPYVDGFKVAEVIREDEKSEETTTVMMLTSDHRVSDLTRIDKLGINCYLVKPIKRDELKNAILTTLGLWKVKKKEKKEEIGKVKVSDLPPMKVLLVEDTDDNRLLLRAFFKDSYVELDEAENGKVAFDKFKRNVYDVVLMDMQMPVMDGYTATRKIRTWEKRMGAEETPVIALTAYALKGDAEKCLDAGCNTHVAKPVKMETLVKVLKEFADKLGL